jgi:hypothetical protein
VSNLETALNPLRVIAVVLALSVLGACAGGGGTANDLPVNCVDKPDPGPCKGQLRRFWYDYRTDSCRMFFYGGCGGHVPFETKEACEETCLGK